MTERLSTAEEVRAEDRLRGAFSRALDVAPGTDLAGLSYRGTKAWDSVGHMQLVNELEAAFDLFLEPEEVLAMSDFAAVVRILRQRGVALHG